MGGAAVQPGWHGRKRDGAPIEGNTRWKSSGRSPLLLFAIAFYSMKVNDTLNALGPKQKYAVGRHPW